MSKIDIINNSGSPIIVRDGKEDITIKNGDVIALEGKALQTCLKVKGVKKLSEYRKGLPADKKLEETIEDLTREIEALRKENEFLEEKLKKLEKK